MCAPGRRGRRLPLPDHADPARGLIVRSVSLRDFRSYARLDLELKPGLVLATGANGAGKTNLLESLHVGTQGFSPRTRSDAELVRFGAEAARIALTGDRAGSPLEVELILQPREARRARLNGSRLESAEQLRREVATLVFTPDRLVVVKGGPAARRAYFDRVLARALPSLAPLPTDYAAALAQRNASLRGVAGGFSSREALAPWTQRVAALGAQLVEARQRAVGLLAPRFAERAGELGLEEATLRYDGEPPTLDLLEARLERDLERGATGLGPHLDEVGIFCGERDLRSFGSQGEQRLAVLSLVLAEAELLAERGPRPLLLLDDVLSELDPERRRILAARVRAYGQSVITTTSAAALPDDPDQLLEVRASAAGTVVA